jgi:hypothetical protein
MYSVEHNNDFYSISGNQFRSLRLSSGQRYTKFKKDWLHVVCTNCKSYGIPLTQISNLLTILSFVACDDILWILFVENCNKIKI